MASPPKMEPIHAVSSAAPNSSTGLLAPSTSASAVEMKPIKDKDGDGSMSSESDDAPAATLFGGPAPAARFERYERPHLLTHQELVRKYPHRYQSVHEPTPEDYFKRPTLYEAHTSWFLARAFLSIFDWQSIFVVCVGLAAVVVCIKRQWYTDMPLSLLATGIVFPISFSISYAASRRERVLLDIASLKASMISLYHLHRDWQQAFPHARRQYANDYRALIATLVEDICLFVEHKGGKERLHRVYQSFDTLSRSHEALRCEDDWVKSVLSRAYQYERYMINDFERIRVLHDYRTASTLRAYAFVFLYVYPVLLAPLFAFYATKYGNWAGIFIAIVASFMVVSLYRVQANMEDPFDDIGIDDLSMGVLREVFNHMLP